MACGAAEIKLLVFLRFFPTIHSPLAYVCMYAYPKSGYRIEGNGGARKKEKKGRSAAKTSKHTNDWAEKKRMRHVQHSNVLHLLFN